VRDTGQPEDSAATLAEVRAVLAAFDWGHDDLQAALEKIAGIVGEWGSGG
jgi:hypothetical protein